MLRRGDDDEDDRVTRSLAGLAVILFLAVAGLFLVERLRSQDRLEDCLLAGRTNCMTIERR